MSEDALAAGVAELGLDLEPGQLRKLEEYLALLGKWNRAFNLTAVRDPGSMVTRHLLDSLAILPHLPAGTCIDVGTGAGLPGIPLALAEPRRRLTLLDSNGKKTRFLEHVRLSLGLENAEIVHDRVESYRPPALFDVVLSRAFASLDAMITTCAHLLAPGGTFLAMKGQYPDEELAAVEDLVMVEGVDRLAVPGLGEERCIVRLRPRPPAS